MWDGIIQVVEINCNFYIYEINLYELGIVIIIILNNAIKRKGDCEKSGKIENNLVFADIYFYPLLATNVESLFPRDPTIVLSTISRTCSASKVYYLNFCKPRFVPLRWFFKIGSDGGPMNLNATIYIYTKKDLHGCRQTLGVSTLTFIRIFVYLPSPWNASIWITARLFPSPLSIVWIFIKSRNRINN